LADGFVESSEGSGAKRERYPHDHRITSVNLKLADSTDGGTEIELINTLDPEKPLYPVNRE